MAHTWLSSVVRSSRQSPVVNSFTVLPWRQCLGQQSSRSMATVTEAPQKSTSPHLSSNLGATRSTLHHEALQNSSVLTTIYSFPDMEPLRFEQYSSRHLRLPLRKDILHRAVIYEGDMTRQGTASTKWRKDVHGSNRKIRPQKGTGRARLGNRKSPMLRGGGVAFGPKPRDFSTDLPRKIYDLAWRTALSFRYQKGELIVVADGMDIGYRKARYVKQIFEKNHWGHPDKRSLLITTSARKNLFKALDDAGEDGRVLVDEDVDVKDLLEQGRIIVEKSALDRFLWQHQSDLASHLQMSAPASVVS